MRLSAAILAGAVLATAIATSAVAQQDWPTRPVHILHPGSPGGPSEITIRIFSEPLSIKLGQQFLVEGKPGAGGNIMMESVARAAPDGTNFAMTSAATHGVVPAVYKKLNYDPLKDFSFVARFASIPNVIVVKNDSPFKTLREMIVYAKANPGKLNFGSLGAGTTTHLTGVSLSTTAGINLVHIPYKGSAPMVTGILSKEIDLGFDQIVGSMGQIKAGAFRALAVTSKSRSSQLPDVPTVAEVGYPDFDFATWYGIIAPPATPRPIIEKFAREMQALLAQPEIAAKYQLVGAEPAYLGPADFPAFAASEIKKWAPIVKASGMTLD